MDKYLLLLVYFSAPILLIIIHLIKELLDLVINKKKIDKLHQEVDKISFKGIEENIKSFNDKINYFDDWSKELLELYHKRRIIVTELKKNSNKLVNSYFEIGELSKKISYIDLKYWDLIWKKENKSEKVKAKEERLKNIFIPE